MTVHVKVRGLRSEDDRMLPLARAPLDVVAVVDRSGRCRRLERGFWMRWLEGGSSYGTAYFDLTCRCDSVDLLPPSHDVLLLFGRVDGGRANCVGQAHPQLSGGERDRKRPGWCRLLFVRRAGQPGAGASQHAPGPGGHGGKHCCHQGRRSVLAGLFAQERVLDDAHTHTGFGLDFAPPPFFPPSLLPPHCS